ncbi:RNA polymerase sigma factor [Novosphingobium sediminis]|uniref:RNA polymerase sigma factor n=1 Tax=Novosphingobium sediminis TaxID=707214 RepID=A0A512APD9_9SPHN|nr:sigma-70 family RNA polymerase sigma factor [Novosphingobium sediminis]GEO01569.1 RNA polymerase sigma factor [Novosphingobium sediminis]
MDPTVRIKGNVASATPEFLAQMREDMLRFARLQLGSDDEAEDAVQEALAGALRNAADFRGEAALKTWIIAILKNKVADILRKRQRLPLAASQMAAPDQEGPLPAVFDQRGMWHDAARPARWSDPEADLHTTQFLAVFDACLNRLPPQQGRVFMMREVVELGTEEICAELGLTINNVHVILHRARLALRACLQINWFQEGA